MRAAHAVLAALLLALAASTSAVECDALGTVNHISGCTACTAVNITFAGRGNTHYGKKTSTPLYKNRDPSWGISGSKLLPNCTECDASKYFDLKVRPANASFPGHPEMARCGCMSGYGVTSTANVTVTWGSNLLKTKSIPTFECVKCGDTQVTLGPGSGIIPVYDNAARKWSIVLISAINTRAKATKYGLTYPVTASSFKPSLDGNRKSGPWGGKGHKDKGPGMGPYFPGQCIDCPTGSKKEGAACA